MVYSSIMPATPRTTMIMAEDLKVGHRILTSFSSTQPRVITELRVSPEAKNIVIKGAGWIIIRRPTELIRVLEEAEATA